MTDSIRVVVVVDWRRHHVYGVTCSDAEAQQWTRQLVARHGGDPAAATMTVGLVASPAAYCAAPKGTTPGHPVKAGASYYCACGECRRRQEHTKGEDTT